MLPVVARTCPLIVVLLTILLILPPRCVQGQPTNGHRTASGRQLEALGSAVNSPYDEVAPVISYDGRTLYFQRFNHPGNIGGVNGGEDIWYSTLGEDGSWGMARNIGPPLNNEQNNFVASIAPSGNTLLVANVYHLDGTMDGGLSISHKVRDQWSFPTPLRIEGFYNAADQSFFSLSSDGKALIIEIAGYESYGQDDLYVSFLRGDGTWSKPMNLGSVVNSPGREITPFLSADGRTLYYSSDYYPGYGDQDVFVTRRLDDTWKNWSPPENLGPTVNTIGWDAYFSVPASGEWAYFVSYESGFAGSDIFRVRLPERVRPEPVTILTGQVLNASTNHPIEASISYSTPDWAERSILIHTDTISGEYSIILPAGHDYEIRTEANGYFSLDTRFDIRRSEHYHEESKNLYLMPIEIGRTIILENVFFEFGAAELRPEVTPDLDRIGELIQRYPDMMMEIGGHTDGVGTDEANLALSQMRAMAVANYMIAHGVPAWRLVPRGYGESRPRATNENNAGRQANRRVEFTILRK